MSCLWVCRRCGGRSRTWQAFQFVDRWKRANIGTFDSEDQEHIEHMMGLVDLSRLMLFELRDIVKPSGLVNAERMIEIYEEFMSFNSCMGKADGETVYELGNTFGSKGTGAGEFSAVSDLCIHGEGGHQRVACVDNRGLRVLVFNVQSKECVATVAIDNAEGEPDLEPGGAAFNAGGELFVSVCNDVRCEICVFDRAGVMLPPSERRGEERGSLD